MPEIVVDDPLAPEFLGGIQVETHAAERIYDGLRVGRCRIEARPADAGDVSLHPSVGVRGTNDVVAGEIVKLAVAKAVHNPRGYPHGTKHDGHGRCEVPAVSLFAFEKE